MRVGGISETNTSSTLPEPESVHVNVSASVTASPSSSTAASPSGKRSRDPEDEVYVDNLHSHKRYLSEIMASSLNGLSVGDSLPENLMDSPARSDSMFYLRDELGLQYSPMSEDLDECRYCESNACSPSPSQTDSQPTSPVSPYRFQRLPTTFSPGPTSSTYPGAPAMTASQARQRGSDSEGRFPSSPSDICHSADLRRAALLRSVQMRTQPMGVGVGVGPDGMQEAVVQPCPFNIKSLVHEIDSECSMHGKSCRVLSMNIKGDDEATD
ncbi:hypothetical protein L2E82_13285 [Cichorium intybus]|uniref:Uncharacterized protein n=1 Tax=Cichorium intybus TaxID=13427 RepID=A0ACB9GJG0_CICIN|nr:hypothetical protein L2E82_13285 [Cichorium intybus]